MKLPENLKQFEKKLKEQTGYDLQDLAYSMQNNPELWENTANNNEVSNGN